MTLSPASLPPPTPSAAPTAHLLVGLLRRRPGAVAVLALYLVIGVFVPSPSAAPLAFGMVVLLVIRLAAGERVHRRIPRR